MREIKQTVPFVIAVVEELPEELPDSLDSTDDKDASLVRVRRSTIGRGQRATTNHVPLGTIAHGRRQRAATMSIFNKKGLKKRLPSFKSFRAMWWMNCPWYQQMNDCLPWPILTDQTDKMQRDLQVGRPHLPPKSVSQQTMLLLLKVVRSRELMLHYGQLGLMMRLTTKRKIKTTDLEIMVTVGI